MDNIIFHFIKTSDIIILLYNNILCFNHIIKWKQVFCFSDISPEKKKTLMPHGLCFLVSEDTSTMSNKYSKLRVFVGQVYSKLFSTTYSI